jgi:hypothetical protein
VHHFLVSNHDGQYSQFTIVHRIDIGCFERPRRIERVGGASPDKEGANWFPDQFFFGILSRGTCFYVRQRRIFLLLRDIARVVAFLVFSFYLMHILSGGSEVRL